METPRGTRAGGRKVMELGAFRGGVVQRLHSRDLQDTWSPTDAGIYADPSCWLISRCSGLEGSPAPNTQISSQRAQGQHAFRQRAQNSHGEEPPAPLPPLRTGRTHGPADFWDSVRMIFDLAGASQKPASCPLLATASRALAPQ